MTRVTPPDETERIYPTKGGKWRVRMYVPVEGQKRKQQLCETFDVLGRKHNPEKGTARYREQELRYLLRTGKYRPQSALTVGALCDKWLNTQAGRVASHEIRQVTYDGYATNVGTVKAYLSDTKVTDLRHSHVEEFKAWALREGNRKTKKPGPLGNDAVAGALAVLTAALDVAVFDGVIDTNPAARVKRPSRRKKPSTATSKAKEATHWTPAQMDTFRDKADDEPLVIAVAMRLVLCGLRRSETLGLTWTATDTAEGLAEVSQGRVALRDGSTQVNAPKSDASARPVHFEVLQPGTAAMLDRLRKQQAAEKLAAKPGLYAADTQDLVLIDAHGRPLRPEVVSDAFTRITKAAGLPRITMHNTRHSIASDLAADPDLSDIEAAQMLGHTVAVFHERYAKPSHEGARRAAEAWAKRRAARSTGTDGKA